MKLLLVLVALLLVALPRAASAHEARVGQMEVEAISPTDARVVLIVPPPTKLQIAAPDGCTFEAPLLHCERGLVARELAVQGFDKNLDLVFVRFTGFPNADSAVITAQAPRVSLPGTSSPSGVAWRYLRFGFEHVLSGLDHVLFLIALFWQAWSTKHRIAELARTATAFTVAHSLTLGLTVLGKLHVPPSVAEACIAFSLVLVALDLGRDRQPSALARVAIAAAFGLVHGLGFAGALAETRLPSEAQWTALFAFNGGVEVGQLTAFAALALLVLALRSLRPDDARIPARLAGGAAWIVGSLGSAMFLLRVMAVLR